MNEQTPGPSVQITELRRAFWLGWAVAELFGRLRRYGPPSVRRRQPASGLARFSYSSGEQADRNQLAIARRRLVELAAALRLHPPYLSEPAMSPQTTHSTLGDSNIRNIHATLEQWSREASIQLSGRSPALGRAMTYGGSFADTYWAMATPDDPAFSSGRRSAKELLRSYRLRDLEGRIDEMAVLWNSAICNALVDSLRAWTWDDAKARWLTGEDNGRGRFQEADKPDLIRRERLYHNLSVQAEVWRDLVFGVREPVDYLRRPTRRRARRLAQAATILLVLAVAGMIGLLAFVLMRWGLSAVWTAIVRTHVETRLIEMISAVVSLLSTVVAAVLGFLTKLSSIAKRFGDWVEAASLRRAISRNTTVRWDREG